MANLIGLLSRNNNLKWKSLTLLLTFTYLIQMSHFSKGQFTLNVYCSPQTDIVPVDNHEDPKGDHRYFPYFIKLARCRGSFGTTKPSLKKCVPRVLPVGEKSVTFMVFDSSTGRMVQIKMKNHTACTGACVLGPNDCNKFQKWNVGCVCDCQHNSPTRSPCAQPLIHVWNQQRCDCVCPTGTQKCQDKNKVWSGESCRCVCAQRYSNRCARKNKVLDEQTCRCKDPPIVVVTSPSGSSAVAGARVGECVGSVKQNYVILIAVLEFLSLLVLFVLFHRFCLQKDDSKFYAMTGTLTRMLPFPAYKSNKENRNGIESINYNDAQITAESQIITETESHMNLRHTEEDLVYPSYGLEQGIEKNGSYDSAIGWYNETMDIDGHQRTRTPSDFSSDRYSTGTGSGDIGQVTIV